LIAQLFLIFREGEIYDVLQKYSAKQPSAIDAEALTIGPRTFIREHEGHDGRDFFGLIVAV
jgi:hypothetical protein